MFTFVVSDFCGGYDDVFDTETGAIRYMLDTFNTRNLYTIFTPFDPNRARSQVIAETMRWDYLLPPTNVDVDSQQFADPRNWGWVPAFVATAVYCA